MNPFLVILLDEDGKRTLWQVKARDRFNACIEAWRRYREVEIPDGEFPPDWSNARAFQL